METHASTLHLGSEPDTPRRGAQGPPLLLGWVAQAGQRTGVPTAQESRHLVIKEAAGGERYSLLNKYLKCSV